jgi:hypothetical protein
MTVKDNRGRKILALSWWGKEKQVFIEQGYDIILFKDIHLEKLIEILTEYKRRRDQRQKEHEKPDLKPCPTTGA